MNKQFTDYQRQIFDSETGFRFMRLGPKKKPSKPEALGEKAVMEIDEMIRTVTEHKKPTKNPKTVTSVIGAFLIGWSLLLFLYLGLTYAARWW